MPQYSFVGFTGDTPILAATGYNEKKGDADRFKYPTLFSNLAIHNQGIANNGLGGELVP
jgi:hypothetical protein